MFSMPSVASLVRTKLAQGVTAPGLGEGRVAALALRLIASAKLPNRTGILSLSSLDRRSCGVVSPEVSHGASCFGLHICLGSEVLGSQGTWLALRKAFLASIEAETSWDEPLTAVCQVKVGFCSEALAPRSSSASERGALNYPPSCLLYTSPSPRDS